MAVRERVTEYITRLQENIVLALERLDPLAPAFKRESWVRPEGGSGKSYTFTTSSHPESALEKAGVNISMIHGMLPPSAIKQMATEHSSVPYNSDSEASLPFFAGGISLILHPRNPNAPTVHANYRYFEITDSTESASSNPNVLTWWFGGVTDLTPSYLFEEDVYHFHRTLKETCDKHGPSLYPAFKKSCDEYFFIKHRNEYRGVGGIRFDDFCDEPHSLLKNSDAPRPQSADEIFDFVKDCGDAFLPSYIPILSRRLAVQTDGKMRRWQLLRRGRYVEFNLLYERGTKFGLATPGVAVENVLMGLPEEARWEYMGDLGQEEDSEESRMMELLKRPREWA
jgi:coproporphyrinogen III oxidase